MAELIIRDATPGDAAACAAIYAHYVEHTAITFEVAPAPDAEAFAQRIAKAQFGHAWLVGVVDGAVVGYAYAGTYMERAAYDWSCFASVYLEDGRRRTGAGRALYEALFARLEARGFRLALAGITLPNDASIGLHQALGFTEVGVFRRVGWKFDAWRDVSWWQRDLGSTDGPPAPLS